MQAVELSHKEVETLAKARKESEETNILALPKESSELVLHYGQLMVQGIFRVVRVAGVKLEE